MTLDWHYRPVPLENPKRSSNARKESLAMMNAIRYEVKLRRTIVPTERNGLKVE